MNPGFQMSPRSSIKTTDSILMAAGLGKRVLLSKPKVFLVVAYRAFLCYWPFCLLYVHVCLSTVFNIHEICV